MPNKIRIWTACDILGNRNWIVSTEKRAQFFDNPVAAFLFTQKALKRYQKEQAAIAMLQHVAINLCSIKEQEFIRRVNPVGITTRQYGYLKGIYERQQREW